MPNKITIEWPKAYRVIRSIYPPIHLFEDLADPADWEAISSVEEKTNPRVREQTGIIGKVPVEQRVAGPGASYVMAPFVHCSTDNPSRFSDGTFGLYYAASEENVALAETIHHFEKLMSASNEPEGWISDFRVLVGSFQGELIDINDAPECLDPKSYQESQALGAHYRATGANGLCWNSVRYENGQCIALYRPHIIPIPKQGNHYNYHWNGKRCDMIKLYDNDDELPIPFKVLD